MQGVLRDQSEDLDIGVRTVIKGSQVYDGCAVDALGENRNVVAGRVFTVINIGFQKRRGIS